MADTVLIVDDDRAVLTMLYKVIKSNGIDAHTAVSGEEALELLDHEVYDLILLDVNLHGMDGFEVVQAVRRRGLKTPIIIVSGRKEDYDTLYGLDIGADDYITKPFNPIEVLARVKSQLRRYTTLGGRTRAPAENGSVLTNGGIAMDDAAKSVTVDGERVSLTPIEYNILLLLLRHPGRVFSTGQIYEQVWNDPSLGSENTVAVHIRHLREKLEIDPANPRYIKVVWGLGYKMEKI